MPETNHVHKYQRVKLGGRQSKYIVMKCMLPGCTHFIRRDLAVGRKSICWKCGGELILNMENTTLKKPTHRECRRVREQEGVDAA